MVTALALLTAVMPMFGGTSKPLTAFASVRIDAAQMIVSPLERPSFCNDPGICKSTWTCVQEWFNFTSAGFDRDTAITSAPADIA